MTHPCAASQACLVEEGELVAFPDSEAAGEEEEEAAMGEVPLEVEEDLMTHPPVVEVRPSCGSSPDLYMCHVPLQPIRPDGSENPKASLSCMLRLLRYMPRPRLPLLEYVYIRQLKRGLMTTCPSQEVEAAWDMFYREEQEAVLGWFDQLAAAVRAHFPGRPAGRSARFILPTRVWLTERLHMSLQWPCFA